ncbi:axoneme-associated protein-like [Pyrus ussuriensis x Pyrus communis]|uniref:Axoneme-associated protein-like n=1 Tax=Pyrus ussuriensis x Pyrus communis TaxID=2448454 RepID=A0A5N5H9F0_9ROSA|nr:axoneme-associated protein-like [Pyrus ussuriensis x Pyrus communis]
MLIKGNKEKGRWEAEKGETVKDNVVVKKVYNTNQMDGKKGLEKERNGKFVEEVKKGKHFNESKRVEKGKHVEDENVEVKKWVSFNGSKVKMESGNE